ncbi:aldo/keto reductase [Mesoterricola sediminis]|uniref:Oxidoreductase n=1 Tax=Mesoterricola sediminis TaxID=2927980 RepID=A0AA48GYG9_9BACT|nr:aldo/keto reductase [Mesoterricola sediminis]BDU77950.1 oxidoreductase [Mesoterricola sediminis]
MTTSSLDRRDLLKLGAGAALGLMATRLGAEEAAPAAPRPVLEPWNPRTAKAMPTRNLGRTGHLVGIFSLGGQAAIEQPHNEAIAVPLIERALDLGVNYLDTSARYGGEARWSEQYLGRVLKRRRAEAFVATKTHARDRDGSLRLLETSLKLLQTDHVDLWQLHAMATPADVDAVCAKGGALEAFREAKEQGLVRFLGLSGHTDPQVLMEAIRRFPFDTVLMAFNAADPHHLTFQPLLALALEKGMGIIGMKVPARGRLLASWTPPPVAQQRGAVKATRPGTLTMREAMGYTLSHGVSTVIVGVDNVAQLEENVRIAREFTPYAPAQLRELEARAFPVMGQAQFYKRDAPQNPK